VSLIEADVFPEAALRLDDEFCLLSCPTIICPHWHRTPLDQLFGGEMKIFLCADVTVFTGFRPIGVYDAAILELDSNTFLFSR
jgi:hypothetical protein